ncbi:MAG: MFS transporter [Calditrichaceae bacterium]|nr:MFS transporter [Calditrichia bacterium]NUQ43573.1 MFS transporter [Calditrichaceae bacterium]
MNQEEKLQTPVSAKKIWKEISDPFVNFVKAPKALWGINIPYVIEGLVYFGILTILGKYCSENVALSDLHAGWVYGFVTGGITFAMLLFGGVSDKIGVGRSLALALAMMMAGRALVALSGSVPLGSGMGSPMFFTMIAGLFMMVVAYGLYQPAAYAGVKRYTNPQTAAMGYAVLYGLMNLGAFFSGFVSSNTRHVFESAFPPNGLTAVFWVYTLLTLVAVLATVLILTKKTDREAVERIAAESAAIRGVEAEKKLAAPAKKEKINNLPFILYLLVALALGALLIQKQILQTPLYDPGLSNAVLASLLAVAGLLAIWEFLRRRPDHPFRDLRFVFFIFMLIPVQTLFAHNWLTLPYYLDRAFAGTIVSEYFEVFSNLNPILIFFLAPAVAAVTSKANVYKMMIIGTLVMAAPTFLLTLGPNLYLLLAYILLMTIGEAMWQPRFLQWIAEIAPEGKTGAYMGIGQMPWFLTKLITASYSGWFLERYCPKDVPPEQLNTEFLWLIYSCIAILSPIGLFLAKNWMGKHMAEQQQKGRNG